MNQREALLHARDILLDPELAQALLERIHDAAAELGIDPLDPSEDDKRRILDRAIENCPA